MKTYAQESKKHYQCEDCGQKYSFVNCPVILADKVWRCLPCGIVHTQKLVQSKLVI